MEQTYKLFLNTSAFAWGLAQPQAAGKGMSVSGELRKIISLCCQSAQIRGNKVPSEGKTRE